MEKNFLLSHSFLRSSIETVCELMVGKVEDFAVNNILKCMVFEAKVSVRERFQEMDQGDDIDRIKVPNILYCSAVFFKCQVLAIF